jgi:nucleotide-binding universal stress UspA family protein
VQGPLIVGVDGSDGSLLGLREAVAMVAGTDRALVVAHIRPAPYKIWITMTNTGVCPMGDIADKSQMVTDAECIAAIGTTDAQWQFEVHRGEPAAALMEVARTHDSDTIVVAGRRHGPLGGFAYGATSVRLFHRWTGALIVLHPPVSVKAGNQ